MDRRAFLMAAGITSLAAWAGRVGEALALEPGEPPVPFSWDILKEKARALGEKPFNPDQYKVAETDGLNYDRYRAINFDPEKAVWRNAGLHFRMQLFHGGYIYKEPVDISIVQDGQASRIPYTEEFYQFGPKEKEVHVPEGSRFYSGFRFHAPIYNETEYSEFLVFQGASYFRGKAKGQTYGLSARGLAVNTAQQGDEEFPVFRAFWVEKPKPDSNVVTVYALLDSKSVSGAYRFVTTLKSDCIQDIECQLYPRTEMKWVGIAPFSSMFFFGPNDQTHFDDFRPRVHDSDGLSIHTGNGDWIWRPIVTARHILYSVFFDNNPKGFGLIQRERRFDQFQDIGAAYQDRPSAWVEPQGQWGEGSVDLIELPTGTEYADNIVAFWRPKEPLRPGGDYNYSYRLTWLYQAPEPIELAKILQTRVGEGLAPGSRFMLIDFAGGQISENAEEEMWDFDVHASAGFIKGYSVVPHPFIDGKRIGIEYHPDGDKVADLSFQIRRMGTPVSEKWVYRWAP